MVLRAYLQSNRPWRQEIKCCWEGGPKDIFKNMIKIRIKPVAAGDLTRLSAISAKAKGLAMILVKLRGFVFIDLITSLYFTVRGITIIIPWWPFRLTGHQQPLHQTFWASMSIGMKINVFGQNVMNSRLWHILDLDLSTGLLLKV